MRVVSSGPGKDRSAVTVNVQFSVRVTCEISRASALICFGREAGRGLVPIGWGQGGTLTFVILVNA